MSKWDDAGWIAIGSYNALDAALAERRNITALNKVEAIIATLNDPELEKRVADGVYNADREDFVAIWTRIEVFKRDNPHITAKHLWSYWLCVGEERFPFTYYAYFALCPHKKKLNADDNKMLGLYRGRTITLLMNTYGGYSKMEATRMAYKQVHDSNAEWTRELG